MNALNDRVKPQYLWSFNFSQALNHFPLDFTLHQMFERQCQLTPHAEAVCDNERKLSYRQLNCLANRCAWQLLHCSNKDNQVAVIALEYGIEQLIVMLAALKAGFCCVMVDGEISADDLTFVIEQTDANVLIAKPHYLSLFDHANLNLFCASTMCNAHLHSQNNLDVSLTGEQLAQIQFYRSSQSVKQQPVGVMLEHQAIINRLFWRQKVHPLTVGDSLLFTLPSAIAPPLVQMFIPLVSGARLVFRPQAMILDSQLLAKTIMDCHITALFISHVQLTELVSKVRLTSLAREYLQFVYCDSAISQQTLLGCKERIANTRIFQLYGQIETVLSHYWDHSGVVGIRPFGHCICNKWSYILDEQRQMVKLRQVGQLFSGGVGLAVGYVNQPKLTNERFIRDEFTEDRYFNRLFVSGDYARFADEGGIELLDQQQQFLV